MISPFTNQIVQFFQSIFPLPTILYLETALTVFIVGIVFYATSTDFKLEDILNILPRTLVSIQKKIDKRRLGAMTLIVLGLMGLVTFSDRLIAEAAVGSGGGGQVLPVNICTNSTIGTSGCLLPANGCDGVYRVGIGRCESGSSSCTGTGVTACGVTIPFSPSFTNAPNPSAGFVKMTMKGVLPGQINIKDANSTSTWDFNVNGTWSSGMPAAATEIFGNTLAQHQIIVNWHDQVQADFFVNCALASSGAGANLQIQYESGFNTGIWTSITGLSVLVDSSIGQCGIAPIDSCYSASQTTLGCFVNIPLAAQVDGETLRIIGTSGGGAADKPQFTAAYLITHTASTNINIGGTCVPRESLPGGATVSQVQITIACAVTFSTTVNFYWEARSYTG